MKSHMNFYILGGALVLLILLTASCACCDFKAHTKNVQYARYEGLEGEEGPEGEGFTEYMEDEEDEEDEGFAEYMKDVIAEEEDDEKEPATIMNQIKGALGVTTKEDMSNMEPRPYAEDDLYDVYGQTVGSLDCGAKSAGLSNSKGPLCLNKKQLTMLSTRGGNAKTDAQIGA